MPYRPEIAEPVGEVIKTWVHQESLNSLTDRNSFLDDLVQIRAGMDLPLDEPGNIQAMKYRSHHDRQQLWGMAMTLEPANDMAMGKHIFNTLMQLSGGAKRLCYFQATDQEDYLERKQQPNVIGIDAVKAVRVGLERLRFSPETEELTVPDAEQIQIITLAHFEQKREALEWLRTRVPTDFGREDSAATATIAHEQRHWTRLATASVLLAAHHRDGDIAAVPILEPKSISDDPQITYPFAA